MDDRTVRAALQRHWDASDASDFDVEHEIYRDDAVLDYPQSGERIRGRRNIQESRTVQPNKKRFTGRRIIGSVLCKPRVNAQREQALANEGSPGTSNRSFPASQRRGMVGKGRRERVTQRMLRNVVPMENGIRSMPLLVWLRAGRAAPYDACASPAWLSRQNLMLCISARGSRKVVRQPLATRSRGAK
jgi:hypothetical protein